MESTNKQKTLADVSIQMCRRADPWSFGGVVVWVFRLGRDTDAQKTVVDFSLQFRCRADPPLRLSSWAVKLIGWTG